MRVTRVRDAIVGWAVIIIVLFFIVRLALSAIPVVVAIATWYLLYRLIKAYDKTPYIYSRFFTALLVSWAIIFPSMHPPQEAYAPTPRFLLGVVTVAVFVGFCVWNALAVKTATESKWSTDPQAVSGWVTTENHPFAGFASFTLMLFTMAYLLMPMLVAFFPQYASFWSHFLDALNQSAA